MYEKLGQQARKPGTLVIIIKVLTYISAALITGFGVFGLVYMIMHNIISSTFFLVFSPIFIILFGGVIIAVQLRVQLVLDHFQFLQTLLGKGLFYIYVSSSVFFFFSCGGYDNEAIAWGCALTLFGLGILFIGLHFTAGDYSTQVKAELQGGQQNLSL